MSDTPDPYRLLERLEAEAEEMDGEPDLTTEQEQVLLEEVARQSKRLARANAQLLKVSEHYGEVLLRTKELGVRYVDIVEATGKAEQTFDRQIKQARRRREERDE